MKLSVICPTLNEYEHIEDLLNFLISSKPINKEIFIVDGYSTDGTLKILYQWQKRYKNIKVILNVKKIVSAGLNLAIPLCTGKYIVRIDAHTKFNYDYFEQIVNTFVKSNADIVGGPTRTTYKTKIQKVIGMAICSKISIGNSKVHDINFRGFTDSVTFGAWKPEIFKKIGYFDEKLVRNQDDEFHYRAKIHGYKIYQNPRIKLWYYPRKSLRGLFKQYFQYGLYKPHVLIKNIEETKMRHLIPSLFLVYTILLPFCLTSQLGYSLPMVIYIVTLLIYSIVIENLKSSEKMLYILACATIHYAYGTGFICGLLRIILKNPKSKSL